MPHFRRNSAECGADEGTKIIYEHLDRKSTDELVDDLSDWLDNLSGEHFDDHQLNAILSALDESDPQNEVFNAEESLAAFHHQFTDIFDSKNADSKSAASLKHAKHTKRSFRRFTQIAAVITIMFCSVVTVQAFGFDIFGSLARWTSSTFHFSSEETAYATIGRIPIADGEAKEYDSLQAALDDFGVTGNVAPKWIPERFELQTTLANVSSSRMCLETNYSAPDHSFLSITIKNFISSDQTQSEKDTTNATVYESNGQEYYLFVDKAIEKAIWVNGELECLIYGTLSQQELKEIVNSI